MPGFFLCMIVRLRVAEDGCSVGDMGMGVESKDSLRKRLRLQGDWDAYIELRDEYRKTGCTLNESTARAKAKFPPVATFDEAKKRAVSLDQFKGKAKSDLRTDFLWVYGYIDIIEASAEMAPSSGAWSILCRCRSDPEFFGDFIRNIWKLLPSRAELDRERDFEDDGASIQELIQRVREQSREG